MNLLEGNGDKIKNGDFVFMKISWKWERRLANQGSGEKAIYKSYLNVENISEYY